MMKITVYSLVLTLLSSFTVITTDSTLASLPINKTESILSWKGTKIGGGHFGKISILSGNLEYEDNKITGGNFEIDMASITCEDLTDESSNQRLVNHLKSDDFFSVEKFPKTSFKITEATSSNGKDYKIKGDLVIKGISRPVSFPAIVEINGDKVTATATIVFDRTKYDIKFRSSSYFENLADRLIYDDVELEVKLIAEK